MDKKIQWTIEDDVVALYIALHGCQEIDYEIEEIADIVVNTLIPKEDFNLRVQNYIYIISDGKEGSNNKYPDGFPPNWNLYDIFRSLDKAQFKAYINMILDKRGRLLNEKEDEQ